MKRSRIIPAVPQVIVPPGAFCAAEGVGDAPMRWRFAYTPPLCAKWRVEMWAKCGRFERYHAIKCEDEMLTKEFAQEFMRSISSEFMKEAQEAYEQELVILRLEGKHSAAYELESKPYRYGYAAYEN